MSVEAPSGAPGAGPPALQLTMEPSADEIPKLIQQIEEFANAGGVPMAQTQRIMLSVDELVTNIVNYGTEEGTDADIRVSLDLKEDAVHIEIEHRGVAFDPFAEAPVPDTTLPLEDRPIGGLGVYLVRSLMSSAHYERIGGRNRITLTRSLAATDQEDSP